MKLNDFFYTVQGEGKNAGRAAWFIRMPHCNLGCPWCDTSYNSFEEHTESQILGQIEKTKCRFVVITGGEPSMNKEVPRLVELLKNRKIEIAMESNGQFVAPEKVDHLTISPKRWSTKNPNAKQPRPPFWFDHNNRPSEIKIVVDDPEVLIYASQIYNDWEKFLYRFKEDSKPLFYLSPEWNQRDKMIPLIVQYVKENPQWKINLQTHKILDVK
jgi:7-carboxy-7-deazaguanine synthase